MAWFRVGLAWVWLGWFEALGRGLDGTWVGARLV